MSRRTAPQAACLIAPARPGEVALAADAELVACPACGVDVIRSGSQQLDRTSWLQRGWQHFALPHVCAAAAAAPVARPAPSAAFQRVIDRSAAGHAPDGALLICAAWRYGHRDLTREAQIRASERTAGQPVEISAEERAEAAEQYRRLYGDDER